MKNQEIKKLAEKVWKDIFNNDTLTYNSFSDYFENEFKNIKSMSSEKCFFSFEHYPLLKAENEKSEGLKDLYLVTTINFTFANQDKKAVDYEPNKPSPNYEEVHKNQYVMTIEQLFDFQSSLYEVAEEIIKIEPMVYSKSKPLKNIVSEIKNQ